MILRTARVSILPYIFVKNVSCCDYFFFFFSQGDENNPQHVRIELTSENDLFFHYTHSVDEAGFRQMQESQKLMIDFPDYCSVVVKMLNNCIKEPHR